MNLIDIDIALMGGSVLKIVNLKDRANIKTVLAYLPVLAVIVFFSSLTCIIFFLNL